MRVMLDRQPFPLKGSIFERGFWPGEWICHPGAPGGEPTVMAHRRRFSIEAPMRIRIHVSADERYQLYLDGEQIGRGPERGDEENWFFETYDLDLSAGEHVLVARHWRLGTDAPFAQVSVRPAFYCIGEGPAEPWLTTGLAPWESKLLGGYYPLTRGIAWGTGARVHIVGSEYPWDVERGEGDGWVASKPVLRAYSQEQMIDQYEGWRLRPAVLPPMLDQVARVGVARHVQAIQSLDVAELRVLAKDHLTEEAGAWNRMLRGEGSVTVAAGSRRRIIIDLENYYCAYPQLVTTGGKGSSVRIQWSESLIIPDSPDWRKDWYQRTHKANRNEIENRLFHGVEDRFDPDGGTGRTFSTLWWEAGRYLQVLIETDQEPLTIDGLFLRQTHYPYHWEGSFQSSEHRLAEIIPIALRGLEMCSHETYMDCPYYEQMQYVGDTRLQVLVTYAFCADDRLPRKALQLFDRSRKYPGFTQSRYPVRHEQTIPPFSAWWIAMLHDFHLYRDDRAFVADLLPGVRAVLDTFDRWRTPDDLIAAPRGWNFFDWVPGWGAGMPPDGDQGISALLNWQLVWVCDQAAELELYAGREASAQIHRERSERLAAAATRHFWDESRGMFADDLSHQHFSEHVQCLALLGGRVAPEQRKRVIEGLLSAQDLARTTIYFSHYLFETYGKIGRVDRLLERMQLWYGLLENGLKTTVETPEPTRSDCHAWGAHPLYHYLTTILGIRPAEPGFARVQIVPQLASLTFAQGTMMHPRGKIHAEIRRQGDRLSGRIELPEGLSGELVVDGRTVPLVAGSQAF